MEYIYWLKGRQEIVFLPPDELAWNQMGQVGTPKKPLKKSGPPMKRVIMGLELIKRDKKLIRSFFKETSALFTAALYSI